MFRRIKNFWIILCIYQQNLKTYIFIIKKDNSLIVIMINYN